MSRRPGERNWGEAATGYTLHTLVPNRQPSTPKAKLEVQLLTQEPPSYLVRHKNGNQWLVITAADGTLEIAEADAETQYRMEQRVLNAVKRYQATMLY